VATLFVAKSKVLQDWGHGVGVTKFLFKVGVVDGSIDEAIAVMNAEKVAGSDDWKYLEKQDTELDDHTVIERVGRREQALDPEFYPKIRGARGIFKVKIDNVENDMMLRAALANENQQLKTLKAKDKDIAAYLLRRAGEDRAA